nr:MAG TPA: hypothetical protein [Caudoviricetes sp.]
MLNFDDGFTVTITCGGCSFSKFFCFDCSRQCCNLGNKDVSKQVIVII